MSRRAGAVQGVLILSAAVLAVMSTLLIAPVAPALRSAFLGVQNADYLVAAALAGPGLTMAACLLAMGALTDRCGARRILILACTAYAAVGVTPLWLHSLHAIVFARLLLGVSQAAIFTSCLALTAGYFRGEQFTRWIAYLSAATSLSATGFYLLGGFLGEFGWRAPFAVFAIGVVIAVAAIPVIFEPSQQPDASAGTARLERTEVVDLLKYGALTLVSAVVFYVIQLQFALLLAAAGIVSPTRIGILTAIAGIANPLGSLLYRFMGRISPSVAMGGAAVAAAAGLGVAATAPTVIGMVAGAFVNQLGCGIFSPVTLAGTVNVLPPRRHGLSSGSWGMSFYLGQFLCPLIVTFAIHTTGGVRGGFGALAVLTLAVSVVAFAVLRRSKKIAP